MSRITKGQAPLVLKSAVGNIFAAAAALTFGWLYSPSSLGVLAVHTAIVAAGSTGASLRIEFTVLSVSDDEDAVRSLRWGLRVSAVLSVVVALATVGLFPEAGGGSLVVFAVANAIGVWAQSVVALSISADGRSGGRNSGAVLAASTAGPALGVVFSGLLGGDIVVGAAGGRVLALAVGLCLIRRWLAAAEAGGRWSLGPLSGSLQTGWVPGLAAGVMNSASVQVLPVGIAVVYGLETAGQFLLINRFMSAPLSLFGQGVAAVMNNQVSARFRAGESLVEYRRILLAASSGAVLVAGLLGWGASRAIPWLYGGEWVFASRLAVWLIPMYAASMVGSPATNQLIVLRRERTAFTVSTTRLGGLVVLGLFVEQFGLGRSTGIPVLGYWLFATYVLVIGVVARAFGRPAESSS